MNAPNARDTSAAGRVPSSTLPPWVCPLHGAELADEDGALACRAGGHKYPRVRGIPRFVGASTYADAFGAQWLRYRRTQLDSYTRTTISRDRARRCIGPELWGRLAGSHVLEAGCGAGRFTEVLLGEGACVTSVDLSNAVEANEANFPQSHRHRIAQADICALPFAPQQYDLVFCLGVVQHTPNPEATITALYRHVRPGGWLVVDHYARSYKWLLQTGPLFRLYFRRLPPEESLRKSARIVDWAFPLFRKLGRGTRHPRLYTRVLKSMLPIATYFHVFPELTDDHQREWARLDTHDGWTDRYKHVRSVAEIESALRDLGAIDVSCWTGGNGVEARARRPFAGESP